MNKTLLASAMLGALSAHASAYTLHSDNGTELNLDIEAVFGVFTSQESYDPFGARAASDEGRADWQEGYIKYGLSGSHAYGESGAAVYGGLNLVSSATWGDGDAAGFTTGDESDTDLEDAYLGWRSGNLIPALGENGLDITLGRQMFSIGDGFLINGDSLNLGEGLGANYDRGGAYWLAARKAFDKTAIVRVGGTDGVRGDLFWLESDNVGQYQMELAGINAEYVMPEGTFGATYIEGLDAVDSTTRDGQETLSLRFQGNAGVENLFLSGEFVTQDQGDNSADADAWYVEAGWTFADLPWSPSVNYRYASFDQNFDPLFYGFSRGYGTWFQGEVAANYSGPFSTGTDVHHIGVKAAPTDMLSVGALFFDFSDTENGGQDGQEIDLYAEWVVTPNLIISPLVGFYTPDNSSANNGTQIGNDDTNVYGQVIAIVPF
ncbi:hypothetical protein H9C73_06010 [Marinobacterium sp. AK62]|uniref:Alginate export domain-containing protein n=1 Tax=Marinobacterium alkalitolerans TaxID=1542925 RepID=A0ABS3ZAE7_9GAMM|nr:alginate export family protein [Marinobacterium alkalitolerans]MBP0048283.1 hypothetical protein [Marinobacterium alkalitolerans]